LLQQRLSRADGGYLANRGAVIGAMDFKRYKCLNCGLVYDEAEGWPDEGVAPGTRWADVPEDWIRPQCGSEKRDFDMVDWA